MGRACYLRHPNDDEYFRIKMDVILEGHVDKYHEFVEVFPKDDYPALLDLALNKQSLEYVFHIIQGHLPLGPPTLAFDHLQPNLPKNPVLYQAIHFMCEPRLFHLLLHNCQAANQVNLRCDHHLLIHYLLFRLEEIPPLSNWILGDPLFQVISSLFLPQLRKMLECARLLALHTSSLDNLAWQYVLDGDIIPLAALLLVAPFTEKEFKTIKSNTSILASKAIHGEYVEPTFCVAAALVYIFDKDGNELTSAFNNGQEPAVGVMDEIAVTYIYSYRYPSLKTCSSSHPEWLEMICEGLGSIEMDDKHKSLEKRRFVDEEARI